MLKGLHLTKSYGGQKIIDQVSIELEPGQISVVIGPSGSGKTTLLKLLSFLDMPESGHLSVDGLAYEFPISDQRQVKRPWPLVTVVFQQLFLWPHLTLRQNITLPLTVRKQQANTGKLRELIDLFDMAKFIDRYPNESSLGQRQRAALVRALMLEPKYLLLDEITSSLDVEQIAIILSHLKDLAGRGIGILTVTHLLHFAHEAADKVVFMDGGQVIESGGRELLDSPQQERVKRFLSVIESAS